MTVRQFRLNLPLLPVKFPLARGVECALRTRFQIVEPPGVAIPRQRL